MHRGERAAAGYVMEALTEAYEQAAQVLIGDRMELFEPKMAG